MPTALARPAAAVAAPSVAAWLEAFERGPAWMRWAAAALVGYALFVLTPTGAASDDSAIEQLASALRLFVEGAAFLWAAARADLPPRLRLALRISAWVSVGTGADYLLLVTPGIGPIVGRPGINGGLTLAGYLGTLWALLVYPRTIARPGERAALAIDTVVSMVGLGVLSWVVVTQTTASIAAPESVWWVRVFGLSQLALIGGLNTVIVRGLAVPSPRAFWWFVSGQALYVPVVLLAQLYEARVIPAWPIELVYFLGVLPTLVAAYLFRTDPMTPAPAGAGPAWLRDLNPLPLAMPLLVGVALLTTLVVDAASLALPLAATLVGVSLLLAIRLMLSAHRSAALARDEAAREQRRQADRLRAVGRLAGGIAHEFNNLMARVVGHTELGEASLPPDAEAREHFVRARAAAVRAGDLTSQLLAFSGQRHVRPMLIDAETVVHETLPRATADAASGVAVEFTAGPGPLAVFADPAQLRGAVVQLVDNALEAMPQGGRLHVGIERRVLRTSLDTPLLPVPAGTYVVVSVSDTGVGMSPDAVRMVCEPFYSTKPAHLGAGLGLPVVHGFVASHEGGLTIDSTPGSGTTVSVYLRAA